MAIRLLLFFALTHGCGRDLDPLADEFVEVDTGCQVDSDCPAGHICVRETCQPVEAFDCTGDTLPLVQMTPSQLSFGHVLLGQRVEKTMEVRNVGTCNLGIDAAGLQDGSDVGFDCAPCDPLSFPRIVAPERALSFAVTFQPVGPGAAHGQMLVRTDDYGAGNQGLLAVPLEAAYDGVPALRVDPPEMNFGYVRYVAGEAADVATDLFSITNEGSGNAVLTIEYLYLMPGSDFTIGAGVPAISPAAPHLLPPYEEGNAATWLDVPIIFSPTANRNQETTLYVYAHTGDPANSASIALRIAGSSLGPPEISVTPSSLTFKDASDHPLRIGRSEYRAISIHNSGQSELTVDLGLDDSSGDFSFSPTFVAPVYPGAIVTVGVLYTPSHASDPAHPAAPERSADAYLRIVSNDADETLTTVLLHGWAKESANDDVLKLEMRFDNDTSSWAGSDFRNVDLELESPLGYSCKKPTYHYVATEGGTYAVAAIDDPCTTWNATGFEGTSDWISGGPFEEPERILLYGLGSDLADGGQFEVHAHYVEDCANIPTGLVADLLGIGVSALLGVLGAEIGVPLTVPPDTISALIAENCWDHAETLVTVTAYVNGEEVASREATLGAKGDAATLLLLRREEGSFTVLE
jgi:hypothetical protein